MRDQIRSLSTTTEWVGIGHHLVSHLIFGHFYFYSSLIFDQIYGQFRPGCGHFATYVWTHTFLPLTLSKDTSPLLQCVEFCVSSSGNSSIYLIPEEHYRSPIDRETDTMSVLNFTSHISLGIYTVLFPPLIRTFSAITSVNKHGHTHCVRSLQSAADCTL